MDASGSSAPSSRKSKPLGKLRRRVQDLRIPSASLFEYLSDRPAFDLSHSESARLAVDCLLSRGLEAYHEALDADGEVDFLSKVEKKYITDNRSADVASDNDGDGEQECEGSCEDSASLSGCPALSTDSDLTLADLDLKDKTKKAAVPVKTSIEIHIQSKSKAASMRDIVREFIRKAETALSIVTETFSDVELLFDLLEASTKKKVSVELLLDRFNLNLFVNMWQELKLNSKNFPMVSVRTIEGQTYCSKTGKKVAGKIAENFIIADQNDVLSGSYSFCWLSWQVHRSFSIILKGRFATPFHQEYHRLCGTSKPVSGLTTAPPFPLRSMPAAQNANASKTRSKPRKNKPEKLVLEQSEEAQNTQADVKKTEKEECENNAKPPTAANTQPQAQTPPQPKPVVQPAATAAAAATASASASASSEKPSSAAEEKSNAPAQTTTLQRSFSTHSEKSASEGLLFRQGQRNRLMTTPGMSTGLNAQRGQWGYSQHFNSSADMSFDNGDVWYHQSSPQTQAGFQFPPRGQMSASATQNFSLAVWGSDHSQRLHQSQLRSYVFPESPSSTVGSPVRSPQQLNSPVGLYWTPSSRAGLLTRQSSFDETYRMGQVTGVQGGWRPQLGNRASALGRSISMTEPRSNTYWN